MYTFLLQMDTQSCGNFQLLHFYNTSYDNIFTTHTYE